MKKIKNLFFLGLLIFTACCEENPVSPPVINPSPKVTLVATPTSAVSGQLVTIKWNSINTNYCTSPNFFTGNAVIGTITDRPTITTTYKVIGFGTNGKKDSATATVVIIPPVLEIGKPYMGGIIVSLNPMLIADERDLSDSTIGLNLTEAIQACAARGEGWRVPDSTELKIVFDAKKSGILKNFVGSNFAPAGTYLSCTPQTGNANYIFCIGFNNGMFAWMHKSGKANFRAVK